MKTKVLIAILAFIGLAIPASAQQFELVSGYAQIGHTPGRIDVLRPEVKTLSLGENVSFNINVRWPQDGYNPCAETGGCVATVGIRHRPDEFVDTWTSFTFTATHADRSFILDLRSKADDNVLPCGVHDVFVRITGRGRTLGSWYFPVAIHVDRCPGQ
jgi:hypothetical protein